MQIKGIYPNSAKDTSVSNQEMIFKEFNDLTRLSTEDYVSFAVRFAKQQKMLTDNEVMYNASPMALSYKFIRGLGERRLNENIVLELEHKPEWYHNLTIMEIANKATRYMKVYNSLPTTTNAPTKPPKAPSAPRETSSTDPKKTSKEINSKY